VVGEDGGLVVADEKKATRLAAGIIEDYVAEISTQMSVERQGTL
jgi:hypothetical protein